MLRFRDTIALQSMECQFLPNTVPALTIALQTIDSSSATIFGLHEELELLVKAGLSPLEALKTATCNPARYLGRLESMGTVEKGKIADLVLLDANPLEDIRNTRKVNAVITRGKLYSKSQLEGMLSNVERALR